MADVDLECPIDDASEMGQACMTLRMPAHRDKRLSRLKAIQGLPKTTLINLAIEDYLQRHGVLMPAQPRADLAS
jgi:hypothetical protein